jgi:starch synthase
MHVVMVASEMAPFAKTGGLADVVGALPKALGRLGHRVSVVLPLYRGIDPRGGERLGELPLAGDPLGRSAGIVARDLGDGVRVLLVEQPYLFDRAGLYGEANRDYPDNHWRFALLAAAALEYQRSRGERPDVFHCHDWQAGLVPVLLKTRYAEDPVLARCATLFTIHNLAYQGRFPLETIAALGLPWHLATTEALEFHGDMSFMKGGLLFSEVLSTVSPQYATEIQGAEMGAGFDGVLRARSADLFGILNGVDYEAWDPSHDPHIARRYSREDLSGKRECKRALLREYGLAEEPELPLLGVTSRLVAAKGLDIVTASWWDLFQRPLRMVVLGSGEPAIEDGFRALAARAPDRFGVRLGYDEPLAHRIEAGADAFLVPSRYEPCGLTQLYSLRYGTPPIVRTTGGLADTVEPFDPATGRGTGFRFDMPDGTGLIWAIDQMLAAYGDPAAWQRLMRNGMARDFSWDRSAEGYVALYELARSKA